MQPQETKQQQLTRLRRHLGALYTEEQLLDIIRDVEAHHAQLRTIQCPPIGTFWAEHGGDYLGIGRGAEGQPDYHLILGKASPKALNHADALTHARNSNDHGFTDWVLPNRTDGGLITANARDLVKDVWHWLEPQLAGLDAYAWCQTFRGGNQTSLLKSSELEVVLVRRVPIR